LKRVAKPFLPKFTMDRTSAEPLHRQLYGCLRQAILKGELPAECRLPSTRLLAKMLGISRNTVLNAYEALTLEGFLSGKIGSCTRVCCVPGIVQFSCPRLPGLRTILRESHYPASKSEFHDPDGNALYVYR